MYTINLFQYEQSMITYYNGMNDVVANFLVEYNVSNHSPHFKLTQLFNIYDTLGTQVSNVYKTIHTNLRPIEDIDTRLMGRRIATHPSLDHLNSKRNNLIALIVEQHRNGVTIDRSYTSNGRLLST